MVNQLRIAHITNISGVGGLAKATYILIREQLKDSDFKIGLLTLGSENKRSKELRKLGCEVLSVPLKNGWDLRHLVPTIRFLSRYTVHHFHTLIPPFIIASLFCSEKYRIYTNRGGHHKHRPKIKTLLMGFVLRRFFSAFTGNTKYATLVASKRFKIPIEKFSVTYNGLNFSEIVSKCPRLKLRRLLKLDKHLVIGTVSLLHKGKYIERLLRTASILKSLSFRILIVGDGPGKQDLINESRKLGIHDKVIFTGMQIPPYDYVKAMDIFVFPSASQSFGNVLIEAMNLEVPAIVFTDGGGLLEHITDGKTGFVVKDEKELAQCIQKLVADRRLRKKAGKTGATFVRKKYSLATMTDGYKKVYQSVLNLKL